jgi:hypothetical protein
VHVDAIGKWTRQLSAVPEHLGLRTGANTTRIAGVATGALLRIPIFGGNSTPDGLLKAIRQA